MPGALGPQVEFFPRFDPELLSDTCWHLFGRMLHPSRDVIFSGQNLAKKCQKLSLDVLEPLKQALLASRDAIISSQICGSNLQKVFTLGDGCWLPICLL